MNKRLFLPLALVLAIAVAIAFFPPSFLVRALSATDVVASFAARTFAVMLTRLPEEPVLSEQGEWTLAAPDAAAVFSWNARPAGDGYDAVLRVAAAPFLAAGLDAQRLPPGVLRDGDMVFTLMGGNGGESAAAPPEPDPAADFAAMLDAHRDVVAYHYQLGHYGIDIGGGNLLEWAADPDANPLGLVFVLAPDFLERAGVNVTGVDGWVAGTVIVHDPSGRKVEVPKLLKPFNLSAK